jgi:hypothetical protein
VDPTAKNTTGNMAVDGRVTTIDDIRKERNKESHRAKELSKYNE